MLSDTCGVFPDFSELCGAGGWDQVLKSFAYSGSRSVFMIRPQQGNDSRQKPFQTHYRDSKCLFFCCWLLFTTEESIRGIVR